MTTIKFSKMHGLGNDFVVIDGLCQPISLSPDQMRVIAHRHYGVGCDQLLLVEPGSDPAADFRYRIFNADGSEAGQCGNGARCLAAFIRRQGLSNKDDITLETLSGLLRVRSMDGGLLAVDMGRPSFLPEAIPFVAEEAAVSYTLHVAGEALEISVLTLGNPHAVLCVDSVQAAPVAYLGPLIEAHGAFPERCNVGFMEVQDRNHIRLRVYERGSGETLACGSGACAAVISGVRRGLLDERVTVELPGGSLLIDWQGDDASVQMVGPAVFVFDGAVDV